VESVSHLTVGDAIVIVGSVGGGGIAILKLIPVIKRLATFVTDILGTPERDGKPATPGLMGQVAQLSTAVAAQGEGLRRVEDMAAEAASAAAASAASVERLGEKVDVIGSEQARIGGVISALADITPSDDEESEQS
jgi:hypothetical protein